MIKQWQYCTPDEKAVKDLSKALQCHPVTAAVLVNRKMFSVDDVNRFLDASLTNLRFPVTFKDMDIAIKRIYQAIKNKEKVLIFGDYDVDGITATALLFEFFQYSGVDISYYIPHRIEEGYGLKVNHIEKPARSNDISLIITVDCGSSSHEAVKKAKDAGIDVIITDHHRISEPLPEALAIVNPTRKDCNSGLDYLAGVGVAFYLLIYLRKYMRDNGFWQTVSEPNLKTMCDLVAMGTVADMVPVIEENRIFVKAGLEILNANPRPGIRAIMALFGNKASVIDAEDIAFKLAPRLNAAGRIDHATRALDLLLSKDVHKANKNAAFLEKLNIQRKEIETRIVKEIEQHIKEYPDILDRKTLVLTDHFSVEGWHEGVLGIVASYFVNKYYRPSIFIAVKNGTGKGSGRSPSEINLYDLLFSCASYLKSFGGHSVAAGVTLDAEQIGNFREHIEKEVNKVCMTETLAPVVLIDAVLDFDNISDQLISELEQLMPFGIANREPVFMAGKIRVFSSKIVGENHRQMLLKQADSKQNRLFNAINFNIDTRAPFNDKFEKMAFRLRWNRWNGSKTVQIVVEET